MDAEIINIGLAFLEGFALIISPCILPILPIILTGSLTGNKIRPFGIIVGFILTFTIVTLFSRAIIEYTHIDPNTLRNISYAVLILLGVVMLSTYLTEKFNIMTQRLTSVGSSLQSANNPEGGFWSGVFFGALIGIIWTPCAGPILAAVVVQIIIQSTTISSIFTVLAFAIGAGIPMLIIALAGRQIMEKFSFFRNRTALFRKLLGLLIIVSVIIAIYSPSLTLSYSQKQTVHTSQLTLVNGLEKPYPAPQIAGIDAWINSAPLTINDLKGKVVLIDFWTYSCINCIRTLPYLKDWYAKYHDQGLVIIGVHSPEFQFEHDLNNVKTAVANDGILYPVALDNQFITWRNFQNQYWPAHYLINKNGEVVYQHFGEGEYDVTENNIRYLLGLSGAVKTKAEEVYSVNQTPETYFGYARAENFASVEPVNKDQIATYTFPASLAQDQWALQGKWNIHAEKIVSVSPNAAIKLHFYAGKVYVVMGMKGKTIKVKALLNGKPLGANAGRDVVNGEITVSEDRLYTMLTFNQQQSGELELTATQAGLEMYTFTFGD